MTRACTSRPDPVSGASSYRFELRDAAQGTMTILMCQAPDTEISRDLRRSLPLLAVLIEPVAVDADPGKRQLVMTARFKARVAV